MTLSKTIRAKVECFRRLPKRSSSRLPDDSILVPFVGLRTVRDVLQEVKTRRSLVGPPPGSHPHESAWCEVARLDRPRVRAERRCVACRARRKRWAPRCQAERQTRHGALRGQPGAIHPARSSHSSLGVAATDAAHVHEGQPGVCPARRLEVPPLVPVGVTGQSGFGPLR